MSDRPFNRRDFLKVAGLGAVTVAFKKPIEALAKATERYNIETPDAKYFPFYERHDVGISLDEIKQIQNLDHFFEEGYVPTYIILTKEPTEYIGVSGGTYGSDVSKRFFPDEYIKYFGDKDIKVSIEGLSLNPKDFELSDNVQTGEKNTARIFLIEESMRLAYKSFFKYKISKDQKVTYPLSAIYWLWAMSPNIALSVSMAKETPDTEPWEKETLAIHDFFQRMHPEDLIVSLRNLFMARRLQVLGQDVSKDKGRKANIAFEVGKAHSGIERFLELGEEITLKTLDIYPDWLLKNIIEYNGNERDDLEIKINTFCSVISIPVKETLEGHGYNKVVIDKKMGDYLRKRFL